jgi:hypothetical protein
MHERRFTRAAGVSPPWVCHNLDVPREPSLFRDWRTHAIKSDGASARRGFGNAVAIADGSVWRPSLARRRSETAFATATRWVSTFRVRIPRTSHGGLTPPALGAVRTFAGEKNDFCGAGTHIHKSGGASARRGFGNAVAIADGSVRRPALARRWSETAFATATRWVSTERICIPRTSHGGLTPPALVAERTFAGEENDFCGAGTHIHKSGGREPAVVSKNASATASDLRGVVTFATAQSAPAPRGAYAPRSWCSANVCR